MAMRLVMKETSVLQDEKIAEIAGCLAYTEDTRWCGLQVWVKTVVQEQPDFGMHVAFNSRLLGSLEEISDEMAVYGGNGRSSAC